MSKFNWSIISFATFQDEHPLTEETEESKPEPISRDNVTEGTEPKAASGHEDVVSGMPL